jgi:hypothetical protein
MTRLTLLLALAIITAAASAPAGEAGGSAAGSTGTTMRYHLDEGQVLVYGAVADVDVQGSGGGGPRHHGNDRSADSETHIEMVFSVTAGEALADGARAITIEILDVKIAQTRELERGRRRIEMDANGVRIYDGKKLEQQSAWGEIQLPSGLDIRRLLETPIEAAVDQFGAIGKLRDADKVEELLRGANFLHLLRRQPVFAQAAIQKGSTWKVDSDLAMSNPLRLRELYHLPGTETYMAEAAVTRMNRSCLQLAIKGDWPRKDLAGGGRAKASGSATAIVDFATGVMFAYSSKTKQSLEGTVAGADVDFEIKSTATITYLGDRATYDKYKAAQPRHD